jgi:multiple sugar transport system ATP-binding protein
MAQVDLQRVTKIYEGGVTAVHEATFTVQDKDFLVLVGPSGCGKSTLLRMVAGLEEISAGTIRIGAQVVNSMAPRDRDIAMVFQNYALYPHMSVFDNMAMGLRIRKTPKAEVRRHVTEAARILGIERLLDRKPGQLSGGQRQRVAVGRAIVRRPQVFLFDEPLSNLDPDMRAEMRTEISRLHHRLAATMIYVTHDQVEAMTMGDRIVVLQDGVVQQVDTPLNLYNAPTNRFVAGFVGTPRMNFLPTRVRTAEGGSLEIGGVPVPVRGTMPKDLADLEGVDLILGIRPEHAPLASDSSVSDLTLEVQSKVDVIEPLGSETLLYWDCAGITAISRVGAAVPVAVDDPLRVEIDLRRAHFFDAAGGRTLLSWPS